MNFIKNHRKLMLFLVSVSLLLVPVFLYSCGGWGTPATVQVMVEIPTMAAWVANGYNNGVPDAFGYTSMKILDANGALHTSGNGHIIGAYHYDQVANAIRTTRSDGVIPIKANVSTKAMMDAIIDKAGITRNDVVVISGGADLRAFSGQAYFNFRYWGFPKKRLKVVNGTNDQIATEGYSSILTTTAIPDSSSTYSVCSLRQSRSVDEVRASLAETLSVAADSDLSTVVWDTRSSSEYYGTNTGGQKLKGTIKTAVWSEWSNYTTGGQNTKLISAAAATALLSGVGIDSSKTTYAL